MSSRTDIGDGFGSRLHGYLHPETSGEYTFWIASDDTGELWLSTDESPANAVLISTASSSRRPGGAGVANVTGSGPIPLEAGRKYYIMALYVDGRGGDNCAVTWQGSDSPTRAVIGGYYLSPFVAFWASGPEPADGATEVVRRPMLSWSPGATAASYDVYLSTDQQAVIDGTALTVNQIETSYNPGELVKGRWYDETCRRCLELHGYRLWTMILETAAATNETVNVT
ncbi:MAG: PA14 domain-containing protein [Planctomycetota bacterium]|jgi:hypothetical protein